MRDWPKRAMKWARQAVPEEITKMESEGASPDSLFDRLSERWKTEMVGGHATPTVASSDPDPEAEPAPEPAPRRSRRTSSGK